MWQSILMIFWQKNAWICFWRAIFNKQRKINTQTVTNRLLHNIFHLSSKASLPDSHDVPSIHAMVRTMRWRLTSRPLRVSERGKPLRHYWDLWNVASKISVFKKEPCKTQISPTLFFSCWCDIVTATAKWQSDILWHVLKTNHVFWWKRCRCALG